MKRIGLAVNPTKPNAIPVTKTLVELIERHGAHAFVDEESAAKIGRPELGISQDQFPTSVEILFVLGGDGTILGFARQFAKPGLPMLGINLGHLGFLSEAEPEDMENAVQRVLAGDYCLEERLMLQAQVVRGGRVVHEAVGLNDVAIAKGSFGRMVTNRVYVDDMYVDQYTGDGLLLSTPTGSTAYSLSCGGPVVSPHIDVIVLTPICPHTLHARPMVIAANQEVRVEVEATHDELVLSVDGQLFYELENHDVIHVREAGYKTTLIKWRDREFFDVLRRKLHVAT
ncbi:NAD(+)/NADH kinase [Tumebacillus flagellatus]|uniref:NAD kinase n=1 Tax=Tumebacillus flagellatus TaxID=1157490 RepID=A0A074LME7_9BACL|nr:NAD(+)/NADH kinase [Tumebacillus flagellatus]KEO83281.1 inorganic polyphosphate kinase [Tumebacillus flagellatus]